VRTCVFLLHQESFDTILVNNPSFYDGGVKNCPVGSATDIVDTSSNVFITIMIYLKRGGRDRSIFVMILILNLIVLKNICQKINCIFLFSKQTSFIKRGLELSLIFQKKYILNGKAHEKYAIYYTCSYMS
jgi:hypothetical protein